jgi:hypothetical protein
MKVVSMLMLPLLAAPAAIAAVPFAPLAEVPQTEAPEMAQLVVAQALTCAIAGGEGGTTAYDAPGGSEMGQYWDGETVTLNVDEGDWAVITGEDGMISWVESQNLSCDQASESSSEEVYSEAPVAEEAVSEDAVLEEAVAEEAVAEEAVAEELAVEELVAEEPVAEELIAETVPEAESLNEPAEAATEEPAFVEFAD